MGAVISCLRPSVEDDSYAEGERQPLIDSRQSAAQRELEAEVVKCKEKLRRLRNQAIVESARFQMIDVREFIENRGEPQGVRHQQSMSQLSANEYTLSTVNSRQSQPSQPPELTRSSTRGGNEDDEDWDSRLDDGEEEDDDEDEDDERFIPPMRVQPKMSLQELNPLLKWDPMDEDEAEKEMQADLEKLTKKLGSQRLEELAAIDETNIGPLVVELK